jgi:hypothetical protein
VTCVTGVWNGTWYMTDLVHSSIMVHTISVHLLGQTRISGMGYIQGHVNHLPPIFCCEVGGHIEALLCAKAEGMAFCNG